MENLLLHTLLFHFVIFDRSYEKLKLKIDRMKKKKNIFVIIGSASSNSANEKLVDNIVLLTKDFFKLTIFKDLKTLPHFEPELASNNPPKEIIYFRNSISKSRWCTNLYT